MWKIRRRAAAPKLALDICPPALCAADRPGMSGAPRPAIAPGQGPGQGKARKSLEIFGCAAYNAAISHADRIVSDRRALSGAGRMRGAPVARDRHRTDGFGDVMHWVMHRSGSPAAARAF